MTLPERNRIDELIDHHGSVLGAIESRLRCIKRRAAEGKDSPCAKAELALLERLPANYRTARERANK